MHLNQSFGGMWLGKVTLDPVSGEIVHTTLALIERELFEADWAAAKQRLDREPTPGTVARWLTVADVERIVFDGPSRVIDVGAQRRFFTGALRRAIEVRDLTCFHPSCDEAPQQPQIDHIHEARRGGPTTQANGRLGCGFHNRWRNHHPDAEWDHGTPDLGDPDAGPGPPG